MAKFSVTEWVPGKAVWVALSGALLEVGVARAGTERRGQSESPKAAPGNDVEVLHRVL